MANKCEPRQKKASLNLKLRSILKFFTFDKDDVISDSLASTCLAIVFCLPPKGINDDTQVRCEGGAPLPT